MQKRMIATVTVGALLIGVLLVPAQAKRQVGSNIGGVRATNTAKPASSAVHRGAPKLRAYNTPVQNYTSKTCVIDFSGLVNGTVVNSVSGCGVKVKFSSPMTKAAVPASWATWGSPPNTEGSTPAVLYSAAETEIELRYSVRGRRVGVEAEPASFGPHNITATFRRLNGTKIGKISRDPEGNAGALLFAGKVKSKEKRDRVKTLTLVGDDIFGIAQIRVS